MVNFRKLENTITGAISGKPFNITRTDEAIAFLEKAQKENTPDADVFAFIEKARLGEVAGKNKYLIHSPVTGEYYLTFEGFRSKQAIPHALVNIINESHDKDIDFMPILKAWARLLTNPRYTLQMGEYFATYLQATFTDMKAVKDLVDNHDIEDSVARNMCTYQDISISKEGMLVTYKVADIVDWEYLMEHNEENDTYKKVMKKKYKVIPATVDPTTGDILTPESYVKPDHLEDYLFTPAICKNGDKFFSGDKLGYVYEVGKMQYLPKKALRNLNNTFGGGGLYTGGLQYIDTYGNENNATLVCFVNPSDILSFQSEGRAFRTDAIFPNNVWDMDVPLKGIYHSSEYEKMSNTRLEELMAEAVAEGVDLAKEQAKYEGGINSTEDLSTDTGTNEVLDWTDDPDYDEDGYYVGPLYNGNDTLDNNGEYDRDGNYVGDDLRPE